MRGLTWRIVVVFGTVLFSIYLLIPSFLKFGYGKEIPKILKSDDPWYYHLLPGEVLKLGLDLSGGLHLVLGIDFDEVNRDAATKLKNQLKELIDREKITGVTLETTNDLKIIVHYTSDEQWKKTEDVISKNLGRSLDFDHQAKDTAFLKMTEEEVAMVRTRAVDQSLETLRNRIDEFGIAEPILQRQGEDKIMLQFPEVQDPGRIKDIISRTAKLSFQVVRSGPEVPGGTPSPDQLDKIVQDFSKDKNIKLDAIKPITSYLRELNEYATGKVPAGTEILFNKKQNINTKEFTYVPYLLDKEALVSGEDLEDARYSWNDKNEPIVNFQLTPTGGQRFERATGENVGKHMAIVLDNNVHSAPVIQEKIGGGRAQISSHKGKSQQEALDDAKDTALVLRSGALPARLEFLEERVVGPSLGRDAIRAGATSILAGLLLVLVFMVVYYRTSGFIAVTALVLNGVFIFSILAAFEGTLTLPGLAGITLTLGMAIDANVLIFEHMREELRAGKSLNLAISEGYSRAFTAIFDSHLTDLVAAVVLLSFGYGPIRGFAVTLLIGLTASLYTSVFVTRVIFDYFIVAKGRKTISI
jgi:protein-export membrane protein SecD